MFTTYFDDSGTDNNSEIAIAACYVSTNRGWSDFTDGWDVARAAEEFDVFHMAHFIAKREMKHEPFWRWDNTKKDRVYKRLAGIVNENKRVGIAAAVPKAAWNRAPERIRQFFGHEHYTFAVRACLLRLAEWRKRSFHVPPVRYIFDWEMRDSPKRKEISKLFDFVSQPANEALASLFGLEPQGFGFEHKEKFKPLQAADILAWQMRCHMEKIWPTQEDDISKCHWGFRLLRDSPDMDLAFFTDAQIEKFVRNVEQLEQRLGQSLPVWYP